MMRFESPHPSEKREKILPKDALEVERRALGTENAQKQKSRFLLAAFLALTSGASSLHAEGLLKSVPTHEPREASFVVRPLSGEIKPVAVVKDRYEIAFLAYEGENTLRYVVTDIKTGERVVYFASSEDAAIEFGPSLVQPLSENVQKAVDTERAFQAAGFTEPTGDLQDPHVQEETREFTGYGLYVKTRVLVDSKGRVVKLISVEDQTEE